MVLLSKWQREKRSMRVVIMMWYMCRRSEKQQINILVKDFPWDISWKYQRPKIRTLIMCLALVVKLLYVLSSAEDRAVFFSISWWNLPWTMKKPTTETGFDAAEWMEMRLGENTSCLLQINEINLNMLPREDWLSNSPPWRRKATLYRTTLLQCMWNQTLKPVVFLQDDPGITG